MLDGPALPGMRRYRYVGGVFLGFGLRELFAVALDSSKDSGSQVRWCAGALVRSKFCQT